MDIYVVTVLRDCVVVATFRTRAATLQAAYDYARALYPDRQLIVEAA